MTDYTFFRADPFLLPYVPAESERIHSALLSARRARVFRTEFLYPFRFPKLLWQKYAELYETLHHECRVPSKSPYIAVHKQLAQ